MLVRYLPSKFASKSITEITSQLKLLFVCKVVFSASTKISYLSTNSCIVGKDVFPRHHISSVIDHFKYQRNADYMGRISQRLEVRISQYVPISICKGQCDNVHRYVNISRTTTARHLLYKHHCISSYSKDMIKAHSDFHLKISKTICIKSEQPSLCK